MILKKSNEIVALFCYTANMFKNRLFPYNNKPVNENGTCVLYWMQSAGRWNDNHALFAALHTAHELNLPLHIISIIDPKHPDANDRSWHILLSGWKEFFERAKKNEIPFYTFLGDPKKDFTKYISEFNPAIVITDQGYAPRTRAWKLYIAKKIPVPVHAYDTNLVIPVHSASDKQEWAAHTIRKKIHANIPEYLVPLPRYPKLKKTEKQKSVPFSTIDWKKSIDTLVQEISLNHAIAPVREYVPGETAAKKRLKSFIKNELTGYADLRNQVGLNHTSHMSAYLHFGHISSLRIALEVSQSNAPQQDIDAYLEELIVRREVAHNYVWYNPKFNSVDGFPDWAKKSLAKHKKDKREYIYSYKQLEQAQTHDEYWNAAQREMTKIGYMHGYMRMYWAKKILEWTSNPEAALRYATKLNDTYQLDGRDPNGWTGIAWAIGGIHDRAWTERPVFGTIRYMNAAGLKRKMKDMQIYLDKN